MEKRKVMFSAFIAACISSVAVAVWRTILMASHYETSERQYDLVCGTQLRIMGSVVAALVLLALALSIIMRKTTLTPFLTSSGKFGKISRIVLGVMMMISPIAAISAKNAVIFSERQNAIFRVSVGIGSFFMLICGMYFIISALPSKESAPAKKYLALVPPLRGIFFICATYFDAEYLFSDPDRKLAISLIAAETILFLFESRTYTGRTDNILHFSFSLITLLLSVSYFLPTMIMTVAGRIPVSAMTLYELYFAGTVLYSIDTSLKCIFAAE